MSANSDPPTFPGSNELRELVRLAVETGLDNRSKHDSLVPMCLVETHDGKLELLALIDNSPRSKINSKQYLASHQDRDGRSGGVARGRIRLSSRPLTCGGGVT